MTLLFKIAVIKFLAKCDYLCLGICYRKSVCLSSVMFVHPTQPVEIVGNVYRPSCTLTIC